MEVRRLTWLGLRFLSLIMLGFFAYAHNSRPANACFNACTQFLNGASSCITGNNGKAECTINTTCVFNGSNC
jgi:hypothetical protein